MTYTNEERENEIAMVFLGLWGSQSGMLAPWVFKSRDGAEHTYRYCEDSYAPEWLSRSDLGGHERDECVTALVTNVGGLGSIPAGYRVVYQDGCGEAECPACEGSGLMQDQKAESDPPVCPLCTGDALLYWGEEWQVVVFAPAICYGSGMAGCLYDNGPNYTNSVENAIDALVESFDYYFSDLADSTEGTDSGVYDPDIEETAMRAALAAEGIFRFTWPRLAGADYCDITDMGA